MLINVKKRHIGVNFSDDMADITVWAPLAKSVTLRSSDPSLNIDLRQNELGYWTNRTPALKPGMAYKFSIDDQPALPDPASLYQPEGVHGPSSTFDPAGFRWTDHEWRSPELSEYIIYELHTGTFSPEGNFEGIARLLPQLSALGVNAIEIMPVSQFPGDRNWGYDGVYPFAVQHSYGGPRGLQQLVDQCHAHGIAVILDVVYNHLGPEGNYLQQYAPYFTDKYSTPWGQAINFDDAWCFGVRQYFIENALMWFRDFHIDALRLDAVHAIRDLGPVHILKEIRRFADELMDVTGRKHFLIAELDLNDPRFINPPDIGGYGMDAQWIDEFHHALRVSAGQPEEGYYSDFDGVSHLAKAYTDAYVYDGQFSEHRKKFFGSKTENSGEQFIVFSQNHDQVGNRMLGERTSSLVSFEMCKLLAGAVMVSPFIPMLFMGEEWAESNPFLFFVSHTDKELAVLVNKGRKEEFAHFNWDGEPPDPRTMETFNRSKLQWHLRESGAHQIMLRYYTELISLRKSHPVFAAPNRKQLRTAFDRNAKTVTLHRWNETQHLVCLMNFSGAEQSLKIDSPQGSLVKIWDSAEQRWNGPRASPREIGQNNPLALPPESILIYKTTGNIS